MAYYCPNCGARIDSNIFFQITGRCDFQYTKLIGLIRDDDITSFGVSKRWPF